MSIFGKTFLRSGSHAIIDENGKLMNRAHHLKLRNNNWIGYGVTILKNVQIGNNTVIGSNSLVCKSFPQDNCAIGGNPAVVIEKDISWNRLPINEYLLQHENKKLWNKPEFSKW